MSYQPAFNARLIAEVKKYPCLYNHAKRGSGDTNERMRIWEEIASSVDLNCTGEFAKKRWLQLRDRYRKELKVAIRQNFSTPVRWCYFGHLSWLDPYLKDNLALAAGDSLSESVDFNAYDISHLGDIKCELQMGEGLNDADSSSVMFESSLDRVLAATHRHESASPGLENDDSGPQSVGTSGDDERAESAMVGETAGTEEREQRSTENNGHLPAIQFSQPAFSIKEQVMARQVQQNQLVKQIYQEAARSAVDWVNDEDMLYSRIIGLKLKNMSSKKRRKVRAQIMCLLDDSDAEDEEEVPSKRIKLDGLVSNENISVSPPS